jgi:hypothetical protein
MSGINNIKKVLFYCLVITLIISIIYLVYGFSVDKTQIHSWQMPMLLAMSIDMLIAL